ncbi:MAG: hypothetical protein JWP13_502 [Candidatus Saccharibacteria bacterium]|nr:hypothetical protein [Candidatus Saccharibacteria bacterium]
MDISLIIDISVTIHKFIETRLPKSIIWKGLSAFGRSSLIVKVYTSLGIDWSDREDTGRPLSKVLKPKLPLNRIVRSTPCLQNGRVKFAHRSRRLRLYAISPIETGTIKVRQSRSAHNHPLVQGMARQLTTTHSDIFNMQLIVM